MSRSQVDKKSPEAVVLAFFESWEKDGYVPAFERFMHPDAIWQNTGFPDAKGKEAYMGMMQKYLELSDMPLVRVETINIASKGNTVLTERIDHCFNEDGTKRYPIPLMGTFVVENGLITRYADYFDPRKYLDMAVKAGVMPG